MGKSIEDMYGDLLTMESVGGFLGVNDNNGDDEEEFMTSKEMVQAKREMEEKFGIRPASKSEIDEEVHFKSYRKQRVHKYTESEMKKIREDAELTIVHDYGTNDIYHLSDEERAERDMLSDLSMQLGGLKRTYRQVDKYVEAMRIVVQAWELLEKRGNFLHSHDEFFEMVGDGRIVSNRIIMPKLKRMDDYNIDTLIKYISNPELDPTDLIHDPGTSGSYNPDTDFIEDREEYGAYYQEYFDNNEDADNNDYDWMVKADKYAKDKIEEEDAMRLLSAEEAQYIYDNIDSPPEIHVKGIPRKYIKGYNRRSILSKKNKKKLKKSDRYIQRSLHELLTKLQNDPANREDAEYNRSYILTHGMFDTEKPEKDFWDDLFFDGSWANDDEVYLYDLATREELLKLHPPKERYLTYADKELNDFFRTAERNGINTIELRRRMELSESGSVVTKAEVKERIKENKKLEGQILQRISKLNNDPKFKKLVGKAEKALNNFYEKQ